MNTFEETSNRIYAIFTEETTMCNFIESLNRSISYIEKQASFNKEEREKLSDTLLGQMHAYLRIFKEIAEDVNRSSQVLFY